MAMLGRAVRRAAGGITMDGQPLTIAVINHNGRPVLGPTLEALGRVMHRPLELLLVDDGSSDGSAAWAQRQCPALRVLCVSPPAGRPSVPRNLALRAARSRYVLLLDHDVRLHPAAPGRLLAAILARPGIAAVTPRLVFADDPQRLYADGTDLHYL